MLPGTILTSGGNSTPLTLTHITTAGTVGGTGTTINAGDPQAGDLLVAIRAGYDKTTTAYGTGFTSVTTNATTFTPDKTTYTTGFTLSYKIATGSEGATIGGFSNCSNDGLSAIFVFRPSVAITSVTPTNILSQALSEGQPTAQTITSAGATNAVVCVSLNCAISNISPTISPAGTYAVTKGSGSLWGSIYSWLYNTNAVNITNTPTRNLAGYLLLTGYLKVT